MIKFGLICSKTRFSDYSIPFYNYIKQYSIQAEYKKYVSDSLHSVFSRMYTNNILGYTIEPGISKTVLEFLDEIDVSVQQSKEVNTIVNIKGVIKGYYIGYTDPEDLIKKQLDLWLNKYRLLNKTTC